MKSLRIIFMGSSEFAAPILKKIAGSKHQVVAVYTQPPRRAGRGKLFKKSIIHQIAEELRQDVRHPTNLASPEEAINFKNLEPDIAIVVAYGLILPNSILSIPKFGCVNIHASILPRWRGAAPIQRAIELGDSFTGISIIKMSEKLDEGPIIFSQKTPIEFDETSEKLHHRLSLLSSQIILVVLEKIVDQDYKVHPQSIEGVSYANKVSKVEGKLIWSKPAIILERQVRAFCPWPGSWFEYNGEKIKVLAAKINIFSNAKRSVPGTVINETLEVVCGSGSFRPMLLQRAGKKKMFFKEFLNGFKIKCGETLN